jgi:uncharacterized membrane protein
MCSRGSQPAPIKEKRKGTLNNSSDFEARVKICLVEILAVVLVVGRVAGWRNALAGSGSAIVLTAITSLILGKSLTLIPVHVIEIIAGAVLLSFGQVWTRSVVKDGPRSQNRREIANAVF